MAYMVPLRFIKVSDEVAVCATRIVSIMGIECYQARRAVKEEKRAGTLVNAAGRQKTLSAIFLDNGTVIASPKSVSALMAAISKSDHRRTESPFYRDGTSIFVAEKPGETQHADLTWDEPEMDAEDDTQQDPLEDIESEVFDNEEDDEDSED